VILKPFPIYDLYENEAPVNFAAMNPKPLRAILQASQKFIDDVRRQDKMVETYAKQCRDLNIRIGLYHLLRPRDIIQQADLFLSVWTKLGGADMEPILDVEVDGSWLDVQAVGQAVWQAQIKAWLDCVEQATGLKPMIYTSPRYWPFTYTRNSFGILVPPAWTKDYRLWVAQYPTQPDSASAPTRLPGGWSEWAIWQYNDKGRSNGFLANDLNIASEAYKAVLDAWPEGPQTPTSSPTSPLPTQIPPTTHSWVVTEQGPDRIVLERK